jgi:hypothetical protein
VTTGQTGSFLTGVDLAGYVTTGQTGSFLTGVDLAGYVTTGETGSFATTSDLSCYATNDTLSNYVQKTETGSFVDNNQTGNFITFICSGFGDFAISGFDGFMRIFIGGQYYTLPYFTGDFGGTGGGNTGEVGNVFLWSCDYIITATTGEYASLCSYTGTSSYTESPFYPYFLQTALTGNLDPMPTGWENISQTGDITFYSGSSGELYFDQSGCCLVKNFIFCSGGNYYYYYWYPEFPYGGGAGQGAPSKQFDINASCSLEIGCINDVPLTYGKAYFCIPFTCIEGSLTHANALMQVADPYQSYYACCDGYSYAVGLDGLSRSYSEVLTGASPSLYVTGCEITTGITTSVISGVLYDESGSATGIEYRCLNVGELVGCDIFADKIFFANAPTGCCFLWSRCFGCEDVMYETVQLSGGCTGTVIYNYPDGTGTGVCISGADTGLFLKYHDGSLHYFSIHSVSPWLTCYSPHNFISDSASKLKQVVTRAIQPEEVYCYECTNLQDSTGSSIFTQNLLLGYVNLIPNCRESFCVSTYNYSLNCSEFNSGYYNYHTFACNKDFSSLKQDDCLILKSEISVLPICDLNGSVYCGFSGCTVTYLRKNISNITGVYSEKELTCSIRRVQCFDTSGYSFNPSEGCSWLYTYQYDNCYYKKSSSSLVYSDECFTILLNSDLCFSLTNCCELNNCCIITCSCTCACDGVITSISNVVCCC